MRFRRALVALYLIHALAFSSVHAQAGYTPVSYGGFPPATGYRYVAPVTNVIESSVSYSRPLGAVINQAAQITQTEAGAIFGVNTATTVEQGVVKRAVAGGGKILSRGNLVIGGVAAITLALTWFYSQAQKASTGTNLDYWGGKSPLNMAYTKVAFNSRRPDGSETWIVEWGAIDSPSRPLNKYSDNVFEAQGKAAAESIGKGRALSLLNEWWPNHPNYHWEAQEVVPGITRQVAVVDYGSLKDWLRAAPGSIQGVPIAWNSHVSNVTSKPGFLSKVTPVPGVEYDFPEGLNDNQWTDSLVNPTLDTDGDGWSDGKEWQLNHLPITPWTPYQPPPPRYDPNYDSDDDGYSDGIEDEDGITDPSKHPDRKPDRPTTPIQPHEPGYEEQWDPTKDSDGDGTMNDGDTDDDNDGTLDQDDPEPFNPLVPVPPENPDPGTGENPDPGTGENPDPGTGENPDPGTGENPDPGTGENPDPGTGENPDPGTGENPDPGTGENPDPGTGENPDPGTGENPDPGTGENPDPGTGENPDPGTGENPDPGTGENPDPGTGENPDPGTGENPDPGTGENPDPGTGTGQDGAPGQDGEDGEDGDPCKANPQLCEVVTPQDPGPQSGDFPLDLPIPTFEQTADRWNDYRDSTQTKVTELIDSARGRFPFALGTWIPLLGGPATIPACQPIKMKIIGTEQDVGLCNTPIDNFLAGPGRAAVLFAAIVVFGFASARVVAWS